MAEDKQEWTIWTPLGGFKRAMGLLAYIPLLGSFAGVLTVSPEVQAYLMGIMGVALGGNVLGHKIAGK